METSHKGIGLIKRAEGYRSEAYRCESGVWTIGYGHTANVHEGQRCTRENAERWLLQDIASAERFVNHETQGLNLRQEQFDALVSFCYNVGGKAFSGSTLLKKVKANPDNPSIREEFGRWIYAGGRVSSGLVTRREAEADLYFGEG